MATTMDWATKTFTVYQSDMANLGGGVYELDVEALRLELHALQHSREGITFEDIFTHNTEVQVGNTILVRVVLIINGYTMTISPSGGYQVSCKGANHNLGDVYNNTLGPTLLPNNSAGLVNLGAVEVSAFAGIIIIDTLAGTSGTLYPTGTGRQPSDNLTDALSIGSTYGIRRFGLYDDLTLDQAFQRYEMVGFGSRLAQTLHLNNQNVTGSLFVQLNIDGTMQGDRVQFIDCDVDGLMNAAGLLDRCGVGANGVGVADNEDLILRDATSEVVGTATPYIDLGTGSTAQLRRWSGGIEVRNMTAGNTVSCDFSSGHLVIAASCTGGLVVVRGEGHITDNSGGAVTIVADGLVRGGLRKYAILGENRDLIQELES